ncbi:MAG TPA: TraR/DksA family transcriptional regulator [Methylomirabilota bacterium]|jgi:RNA polymerase-binding transcription factor DksA|nr:TraR/DksA family transcriptional regulator [Methylomirabilota bacterium]
MRRLRHDRREETARHVLTALDEREPHALAEIDAAEARLSGGTFGLCEACGWAIPLSRLRAVPVARLCIPCQATKERSRLLPRI